MINPCHIDVHFISFRILHPPPPQLLLPVALPSTVFWPSPSTPRTAHPPLRGVLVTPTAHQPVSLHTNLSHCTPTCLTSHQPVSLHTNLSRCTPTCLTAHQPVSLHTNLPRCTPTCLKSLSISGLTSRFTTTLGLPQELSPLWDFHKNYHQVSGSRGAS